MAKPIVVEIIGDAKKFTSSLGDAETSLKSFSGVLDNIGWAAAAAAAVSATTAIGVGLFKMGETVTAAFDHLIIATGASGDALTAMEGVVNDVAQTVPQSFGDIADAVALISQKLDLTGAPLEALTTQVLNLAHITGTDVMTEVSTVTDVFNKWQIATEDQAGALDELFRASQASGVSVDELATSLTNGGAVFQEAGYDFAHTTALLAAFGKEGVNSAQVQMGLKKGVATISEQYVASQRAQAKAAEDAADRVVAAAERREAVEERLAQIAKDGAKQAAKAQESVAEATDRAAETEEESAKKVAQAKVDAAKALADFMKNGPINNGVVAMENYQKKLAEVQADGAQKIADAEDAAAKRHKDAAKDIDDANKRVVEVTQDTADSVADVNKKAAKDNEKASAAAKKNTADVTKSVAKSGESVGETMTRVINQIKTLPNETDAIGLAVEVFGTRAGTEMAKAIRSGRFEVDALTNSIEHGSNTVNDSADKTRHLGEQWAIFKKDVLVPLEPLAVGVFDAITRAMAALVPYALNIPQYIKWFGVEMGVIHDSLAPGFTHMLDDLGNGFRVIGDGVRYFKDGLQELWAVAAAAPGWLGSALGGFVGHLGLPGHAAGGSMLSGGWSTVGERGPENVWLPQGAQVQPSWSGGGGGRGGDTYNINGSNLSAAGVAREIAWQRRRGDGR